MKSHYWLEGRGMYSLQLLTVLSLSHYKSLMMDMGFHVLTALHFVKHAFWFQCERSCIHSNASTETSRKFSKTLASISSSQEIQPPNLPPRKNKNCTTLQFHWSGTDASNTTSDDISFLSQVQITDGKHYKSFLLNSLSGRLPL